MTTMGLSQWITIPTDALGHTINLMFTSRYTDNYECFADYLVLILEELIKEIEILMAKFKEFGEVAGFKLNKVKNKNLN